MTYYKNVSCLRCGQPLTGPFYEPCPHCLTEGYNINYETKYDLSQAKLPGRDNGQPGIFRYREFYPLADDGPVVSLYEGDTPLKPLKRLGRLFGLNNLYYKDESQNPTGSHKDRMCALIVSKALADDAPGITISSTGNQGAAAAAYASVAGLPCLALTTPNVSLTMKTLMQVYGAYLFVTPTMADRAAVMEKCVRDMGFVPASGLVFPPIGSSCFGVDGYKSLSFELYEQMGNTLPEWLVMPISYGDAFYGVYKGLRDLAEMGYARMPKLAAAEVFGSLKATLEAGAQIPLGMPTTPSIQTSIATGFASYQALQAVRESQGCAECCNDAEALEMQKLLARTEGIYAETASVASLVVVQKLYNQGQIGADERVVAVITSGGVKDPDTTRLVLPEVPLIEPTVTALRQALKNVYGVSLKAR